MTLERGSMWAAALLLVACGEATEQRRSSPADLEQGAGAGPTELVQEESTAPAAPTADVAGGETSEFSGGDIPGCPCGTLKNPLRATVVSVAGVAVRLRVDELPLGAANAEVGSEIEGDLWFGGLPCYFGRAAVAAGDEVLAFYWPSTVPGAGRIALTQWGPTVLLADATRDLTISVDDLPLLDAPEAECVSELGNIGDYIGPADDMLP